LERSSLQDLELVEGEEAVDVASGQTQDAKGEHHLQISWVVVAKVDYPPLEAAVAEVLRRLHNKMRHVTRHRCIPTSSNGMRTGMFVSLAVLM
jgi:precorrin-2 methylase